MNIGGGRYELGAEIGTGGMGSVFQGVDTQTGERVAIKMLRSEVIDLEPDVVARFAREAEALRQLNHPNIVRVLDTFEEYDRQVIVMEYVAGGTLDDLMDAQPHMPVDRVLEIALELADALTRAHHLKIIHRDLKPGNVLIAEDGTPRLTDFGVAYLESEERVTRTGVAIGTPDYLPPEALQGGQPSDARADIWAFGVMLFEMLAGRRPFKGDNLTRTLSAIVGQPTPNLRDIRPDCPAALVHMIEQMLEKDPNKRISSIRVVGAEIEAIIRGNTSGTPLHSRFDTPTGTNSLSQESQAHTISQRSIRVFGGIAFILLLMVVGVLALLTSGVLDDDLPDLTATVQAFTAPTIAEHEYRVLVAQIEPLGVTQRSVTRFIMDDLKQHFEVTAPYSNIRLQEYPGVMTSAQQAREIAEQQHAAVVIWGNYNTERIQLEIQVGATDNAFDRALIERTANIRAQLTDEHQQTIAPYISGAISVMAAADGNILELARSIAVTTMIETEGAEAAGSSTAVLVHRFLTNYRANPDIALNAINAAAEEDTGNALLYMLRSVLLSRRLFLASDVEEKRNLAIPIHTDITTAQRLGPPDWTGPLYVDALLYFYFGQAYAFYEGATGTQTDILERLVTLRPDDWFALYLAADHAFSQIQTSSSPSEALAAAQDHIDRALTLNPDLITPYITATLLALYEGDLIGAAEQVSTTIADFPNPDVTNRIFRVFTGNAGAESALATVFSHYMIGQYESAVEGAQSFFLTPFALTGGGNSRAGLYLITGLSQCNLANYAAAYTAYQALYSELPGFTVVQLLQMEARDRQGGNTDVLKDRVERSAHAAELAPYLRGVQLRQFGCRNLFDLDALQNIQQAAESTAGAS